MSNVVSVFDLQGDSAPDFDDVLKQAIPSEAAWNAFVRMSSTDELGRAAQILDDLRKDIAGQRKVMAARQQAGRLTSRQHMNWLAKAQMYDLTIQRRQRDLPRATPRPAIAPQPGTATRLRHRVAMWQDIALSLTDALIAFEAGDVTRTSLAALLDDTTVELGKLGEMNLRAAAAVPRRSRDDVEES